MYSYNISRALGRKSPTQNHDDETGARALPPSDHLDQVSGGSSAHRLRLAEAWSTVKDYFRKLLLRAISWISRGSPVRYVGRITRVRPQVRETFGVMRAFSLARCAFWEIGDNRDGG